MAGLGWRRRLVTHPTADPILEPVGMNPFRPQKRRPGDYVMVVAAVLVCAALVFWAARGF